MATETNHLYCRQKIRSSRRSALKVNGESNSDTTAMRTQFSKHLDGWLLKRAFHMPSAPLLLVDSLEGHPEKIKHLLPSSYSAEERSQYGLVDLASLERTLREAQAHDILRELRQSIQRRVLSIMTKKSKKAQRGQKPNTRMEAKIRSVAARVTKYRAEYGRVREALLRLGMSPDDPTFQVIEDSDVTAAAIGDENWCGQGKVRVSWIWRVGKPDDVTDLEWSTEGEKRVLVD